MRVAAALVCTATAAAASSLIAEPAGRRALALSGTRLDPDGSGGAHRNLAADATENDMWRADTDGSLDAAGLAEDPFGRAGLVALLPGVEARQVAHPGTYTVLSFPRALRASGDADG